jgi:preprotein translocase subunit SecD
MAQQTPYPPPQYQPQKQSRGPLLVLIGVLGLVLVAVLAIGAVVLLRNDNAESAGSESATKPAVPEAVQFRRVIKVEPGVCETPSASTACGSDGSRYTLGKVELDGSHVTEVTAGAGPDGAWYVNLSLDQGGAELFGRLTSELAAKTPPDSLLAIVVRGRVVSAPVVASPITGGKVQINSNFTKQDAEKLAAEITG